MVETVGKGNFENGSEQLCVDIDNKVDMIYTVCVIESRKSPKESHKRWYRLSQVCLYQKYKYHHL